MSKKANLDFLVVLAVTLLLNLDSGANAFFASHMRDTKYIVLDTPERMKRPQWLLDVLLLVMIWNQLLKIEKYIAYAFLEMNNPLQRSA
jgi:hypothetical protein